MKTKSTNLTKKQETVLNYIKQFYADNKYPPSVRQIGTALSLKSPATIHSHIQGLIEKGYIKRRNGSNRALELLVDNEYFLDYDSGNIYYLDDYYSEYPTIYKNNDVLYEFKLL